MRNFYGRKSKAKGARNPGISGKHNGAAGVGEAIAGISLRDVVSDKIAVDMQKETDFARIRDQLDHIERGIWIMRLLG